jgi:hypothetical protein
VCDNIASVIGLIVVTVATGFFVWIVLREGNR